MKIATKVKQTEELGTQLILEENKVIGVNILFENKILLKKRFNFPKDIKSLKEEHSLIKHVLIEYFNQLK